MVGNIDLFFVDIDGHLACIVHTLCHLARRWDRYPFNWAKRSHRR